jgi:TolA-binding protein
MSKEKQHSPQHQEVLKKQALQQSEVKEVLDVIKKYAVPATIFVLVVCGVFLFDRYLKTSKASKEAAADAALVTALSAADYEEIIEEYGSTASAPIAMMRLAMARFSSGEYAAAQELYEEFAGKYSKHEMALQAELNAITCRESKGEFSEAHLLYGDYAANYADSYLAPVAKMGQARCLEAMGNPAEAKRAYEDLVVTYPESSWADLAETRMSVLASKLN